MSEKHKRMASKITEAFQKNIIYIGVFLDESSQKALKEWWPEATGVDLLTNPYAHHMTLHFRPKPPEVGQYPIGESLDLEVVGFAQDDKSQAVVVRSPVGTQNDFAHITIATDGTPPSYSNELLKDGVEKVSGGPKLRGRVGYWDGKGANYE